MTNGMTGTVASTETTVYNISKKGKLTTKLVKTKDNINNTSTYKINGKKSTAKKYKEISFSLKIFPLRKNGVG
jgi:hypothetical protein